MSDAGTDALADHAASVLAGHWRDPGFCVPNADVYPAQWLWDSCFHAVAWAHLGEADRAVVELGNVFAHQGPDGFVPHITYWHDPERHAEFWGRPGTSTVTQPPMFGHAIATLVRLGIAVPGDLVDRARAALGWLMANRTSGPGAVPAIVHPWESGCDDSPRWDAWCPPGPRPATWRRVKGELVDALVTPAGASGPTTSRTFLVESAAFGALVAFNARELDEAVGAGGVDVDDMVATLLSRWSPHDATFVDHAIVGAPGSAARRTVEALLPVLVADPRHDAGVIDEVFAELVDPARFGGSCGPAQVHRADEAYDPRAYWRGPAWPQLTYLFWVAACRHGRTEVAAWLAGALRAGARASGFAEYWDPDTGEGLGARPQSWAALAAAVTRPSRGPSSPTSDP